MSFPELGGPEGRRQSTDARRGLGPECAGQAPRYGTGNGRDGLRLAPACHAVESEESVPGSIVSVGHGCLLQYVCFHLAGFESVQVMLLNVLLNFDNF